MFPKILTQNRTLLTAAINHLVPIASKLKAVWVGSFTIPYLLVSVLRAQVGSGELEIYFLPEGLLCSRDIDWVMEKDV